MQVFFPYNQTFAGRGVIQVKYVFAASMMKRAPKNIRAAAHSARMIFWLRGLRIVVPAEAAKERIESQMRSHSQWIMAKAANAIRPKPRALIARLRPTVAHQKRKYGFVAERMMPVRIGPVV